MGVSFANIDIGSVLTGAGSFLKDIRTAITGKEPISETKAMEYAVQIQTLENVIPQLLSTIDVAQTAVNEEEAKSNSFFTRGWRPMCGWVCTFALVFNYMCAPIIKIFYPAFPSLDLGELITLLFGMLGLGTLRTIDKKK
jgi:Holin of 3TMs, for gene-transfer release